MEKKYEVWNASRLVSQSNSLQAANAQAKRSSKGSWAAVYSEGVTISVYSNGYKQKL
jgi:hypothetical protein